MGGEGVYMGLGDVYGGEGVYGVKGYIWVSEEVYMGVMELIWGERWI